MEIIITGTFRISAAMNEQQHRQFLVGFYVSWKDIIEKLIKVHIFVWLVIVVFFYIAYAIVSTLYNYVES